VILLRSEINQGKAHAVLWGAEEASSEFLLLVDADLKNIQADEFSNAISTIQSNPEIDMIILRRIMKDPLTRLFRGDITVTGERIIRRSDLIQVIEKQRVQGFQLEVAINQYMLERKKHVRWLPVSSIGVLSFQKMGFLPGLKKEIRMFSEILAFIGFRKMMYQVFFLGRQRI
jgi:glycosyltransferase involved in cell wall biosynthesis